MISTLENEAGAAVTLAQIELAAKAFEGEATALEVDIADMEADLAAVKLKHLAKLKKQAATVARREAELRGLIEAGQTLFRKPRTIIIHGVKVGYTVSQGKLVWDCSDETLLERIRNLFPQSARRYINVVETPNKEALRGLKEVDRETLGVSIEGAGDVVMLKRVDGDVEKLIDKLMEKMVEAILAEK